MNYVGVLKDILKLDYRSLRIPIVFFRQQWLKRHDSQGNPIYTRDDTRFLVVNFRHKMPRMSKPFIFSTQAIQVFLTKVRNKPGWKVVLCKDARTRKDVLDTLDVFITTTVESRGLIVLDEVPILPSTASLIEAIELSAKDHLLACASF